jgi:hypothetical protein
MKENVKVIRTKAAHCPRATAPAWDTVPTRCQTAERRDFAKGRDAIGGQAEL